MLSREQQGATQGGHDQIYNLDNLAAMLWIREAVRGRHPQAMTGEIRTRDRGTAQSPTVATGHMWLWSPQNVAGQS